MITMGTGRKWRASIPSMDESDELQSCRQNKCGHNNYCPNEDRAVIAFLRHNASNYDKIQAELPSQLKQDVNR
jgi:hypothetical protein